MPGFKVYLNMLEQIPNLSQCLRSLTIISLNDVTLLIILGVGSTHCFM